MSANGFFEPRFLHNLDGRLLSRNFMFGNFDFRKAPRSDRFFDSFSEIEWEKISINHLYDFKQKISEISFGYTISFDISQVWQ